MQWTAKRTRNIISRRITMEPTLLEPTSSPGPRAGSWAGSSGAGDEAFTGFWDYRSQRGNVRCVCVCVCVCSRENKTT